MQNTINFQSSTTRVFVSAAGVTSPVVKVLVGTIGGYRPMLTVEDTGPTDKEVYEAFMGDGVLSDVVYRADFSAYYQLIAGDLEYNGLAANKKLDLGAIILKRDDGRLRVWSDKLKGEGKEVLVGSDEETWNLADPAGRAAFIQLSESLWVEGHQISADERDTGLSLLYRDVANVETVLDRILFSVLSVGMEIYKPKVVDPAEPMIPDAGELSKGSVTFVNLDNDDNNSKFDHGGAATDDEVTGGDDELVKVKLKLKPSSLTHGQVKLLATAGAGNIAVWTNDNKAAASVYTPGTVLNVAGDFTVEGDSLVKTMWVEGISAHTAQQGTKLKMEYTISGTTCEDEAALTVVGVDQITWRGKANSLNDNDTLDADPNWPGGLTPNGLRVFPDARIESGTVGPARDKVNVEVTLTVAPPHQIKLYLKSFDADDPTADTSPVDDEANEEDNRGTSPAKAGRFTGESGGVLELVFPDNVKTTNCEFQTTMQPGDNFRIVANGDKDFLSRLENKDAASGASNADKQRICNKDVSGTLAEREVRQAADYASDTLVIWRFLHVEVDSMGPVTNNFVAGNITAISGNASVATNLTIDVNLRTGLTPQDNSANLSSFPSGNGRFENGGIRIGADEVLTTSLLGNGDIFVTHLTGFNIPAEIVQGDATVSVGQAISLVGNTFTVTGNLGTNSYSGATLVVAGTASVILGNTSNTVTVGGMAQIPFALHDDDMPVGTDVPKPDLSGVAPAFEPAYVLPIRLHDGEQDNLPFIAHMETRGPAPYIDSVRKGWVFDYSAHENNPNFWVIYVRGAFQDTVSMDDDDPNGYGVTWGIADGIGNGQGVNIYIEVLRPAELATHGSMGITEVGVVIHEIGHLFGGLHEQGGAMWSPSDPINFTIPGAAPAGPLFAPVTINLIRNIPNP